MFPICRMLTLIFLSTQSNCPCTKYQRYFRDTGNRLHLQIHLLLFFPSNMIASVSLESTGEGIYTSDSFRKETKFSSNTYYPLVMSFSSALPFIVSYIFKCPRWSSVLKVREQNKKLKNNASLLPELFSHQSIFQCLCCYVVKWILMLV